MKQYKALSPKTACMFFSVDEDAGKILCMSCVPAVSSLTETTWLLDSHKAIEDMLFLPTKISKWSIMICK